MRICARCDEPILPGQAYDTEAIDSPSVGGASVDLHKELCIQPPHQTAPVRKIQSVRE